MYLFNFETVNQSYIIFIIGAVNPETEDSSSLSTINGNSLQNFDVHSSCNFIHPNITLDSYISGMSTELSPKKSNQIESESDLYKTGKYMNSGRKKIPASLRRSASTVSDIQFMRRGKTHCYVFSNWLYIYKTIVLPYIFCLCISNYNITDLSSSVGLPQYSTDFKLAERYCRNRYG